MQDTIDTPPVITTALAEYQPTAAALAELRQRFAGIAFDLTTTKGDKEARAARLELVRLRSTLESKRVELKAPALERSRLIDSEAKRITSAILELETPIDDQIRAAEAKREQERQARVEAERARVAALQARIDQIKAIVPRAVGKPAADIEAKVKILVAMQIGADFQELQPAAEQAHRDALTALRELHAHAVEQEAEAQRLKAERAELERLRAEQAAEDALVASINAHAARIEGQSSAYVRKAIIAFGVAAGDWADDPRPRVAAAVVAGRQQLADRLAAAEESERAAEQRRLIQVEREAAAAERQAADERAAAERAEADRIANEARAAEQRRIDAERAELERQQAEAREQQALARHLEQQRCDEAERIERERRAAEDRQRDQEAAECAAQATRLANAAQVLLDALVIAIPYVATHGTADELAQCNAAIDAAT